MFKRTWFDGRLREFYVIGTGGLLGICDASTYLWFSSVIYSLEQPDSVIPITSLDSSWIASIFAIGVAIFSIPAGYLVNVWGRKPINLAASGLIIVLWSILGALPSITVLYAVRFIQGAIMSIHHSTIPSYLAELAVTKHRGGSTAVFSLAWRIGNLYSILGGVYFSYENFIYFTIAPNILASILFMWCPESPYFLLMKHRRNEAAKSIAWIRGKSVNDAAVVEELRVLEDSLKDQQLNYKIALRTIFFTKKGRKGLFTSELVGLTTTITGVSSLMTYEKETVTLATGSVFKGDMIFSAFGLALVLVMIVPILLVDKIGRRPLVLISSAGCTIFLFLSTLFITIQHFAADFTAEEVLQIAFYVSTVIFVCLAVCGSDTIAPVLSSELFLTNERPLVGGITNATAFIVGTIPLNLYRYFEGQNALYVIYMIFFLASVLNFVGFYFTLTETKGKTFNEIQEVL